MEQGASVCIGEPDRPRGPGAVDVQDVPRERSGPFRAGSGREGEKQHEREDQELLHADHEMKNREISKPSSRG
jgi:hypothetical protein